MLRIPVTMVTADGHTTDGTCAVELQPSGSLTGGDFRDLDGAPMPLPAGASYLVHVDLATLAGGDSRDHD